MLPGLRETPSVRIANSPTIATKATKMPLWRMLRSSSALMLLVPACSAADGGGSSDPAAGSSGLRVSVLVIGPTPSLRS